MVMYACIVQVGSNIGSTEGNSEYARVACQHNFGLKGGLFLTSLAPVGNFIEIELS